MLDDSLLDDPGRLTDADTAGLLRTAARAGAQVRATAESAAELGLDRVADDRPRALVLVTRPGVGLASARILAALLGPGCPVPVVLADAIPSWVGALDLVVAHTEDPGDTLLAESVYRAARRGARLVLTAPDEGPIAAAAAGQAVLLPPRVPAIPGFDLARALTGGLLVANRVGLLTVDLDLLADELDREAERDHPVHEAFVNPAKSMALRLAEHTPLLWGLDPVATAVAGHAASVLAGYAGAVCDVAGYQQALGRPALYRAAARAGSEADIFADPDDLAAGGRPRVLLLAVRQGPAADQVRRDAERDLPGADLVQPAEEVSGGEAVCAALLALRFDMAALYLGLAAGTLGGPGQFAPVAS